MGSLAQFLVVSPDRAVLEAAKRCLHAIGHASHLVSGLGPARRLLSRLEIDALLLDTLLPNEEIEAFWNSLRSERGSARLPATVLLAPPSSALAPATLPAFYERRRHGLATKPLDAGELGRQVSRALANNARSDHAAALLRAGGVTLDRSTNQLLFAPGGSISLTPTESRLLNCLMQHSGDFVPTEELVQDVWGYAAGAEVLRAHVSNLRRKLRDGGQDSQLVRTMPYHGYGFASSDGANG